MADYSNLRMSRQIFFAGEGATKFGQRLQSREKALVNPRATDTQRCALLRHAELNLFEVAHIRVGLSLRA